MLYTVCTIGEIVFVHVFVDICLGKCHARPNKDRALIPRGSPTNRS